MAAINFIPAIWSVKILDYYETATVLGKVCNRNYEGEIQGQGSKVKIRGIGDVDVVPYDSSTGVNWQKAKDASLWLDIDQTDSFALEFDDVEQVQSDIDMLNRYAQKAAYKMRKNTDSYIAELYSQAYHTVTHGSVDTASILSTIGEAWDYLEAEDVPEEEKWIALPPWAILKLKFAGIIHADDLKGGANGFVKNELNFDIYKSNNLATSGATKQNYAMAGSYEAISFANQLDKTEAVRREDYFSDGIKGLHVYGGKVIKPRELVQLDLTYTDETTI